MSECLGFSVEGLDVELFRRLVLYYLSLKVY